MKISELLRALADKLDTADGDISMADTGQPHAELYPVDIENIDHAESEAMVPPLQQKLELLKKAVDVNSYFDDPQHGDDDVFDIVQPAGEAPVIAASPVCGGEMDEIAKIKRLAGIFAGGEDTDLDF